MANRLVLITGINGYIATHTAAAFLQAGYAVRGTVRARTPALVSTLTKTLSPYHDGTRLDIIEVPDISAPRAFDHAVDGVHAVTHLASPVSTTLSDPIPVLRASIAGTTSLLASCSLPAASHLRSVVFMSTISAIFSPLRDPGYVFSETDWNDVAEKEVEEKGADAGGYTIYQASKTAAERAFWRVGREGGLKGRVRLVGVCPAPVLGPPLYLPDPISKLSMRVLDIYNMFHGGPIPEFSTIRSTFVDVRDVASVVVSAVEDEAATGRYLLVGNPEPISPQAAANVLRERYPERRRLVQEGGAEEPYPKVEWRFDSGRAKSLLGREWIGFEESVVDSAESFLRVDKRE